MNVSKIDSATKTKTLAELQEILSNELDRIALRKAFPRVLEGVYVSEEMEQAGPAQNGPLAEAATRQTAADRLAARRQAVEAQQEAEPGVIEGTATAVDDAEIPTEPVDPKPAAASTPPPATRATPPKAAAQAKPSLCLVASPYGDGQACGLPKDHEGLHKSVDQDGSIVGSWE